jgi:subtilisin family serine protease
MTTKPQYLRSAVLALALATSGCAAHPPPENRPRADTLEYMTNWGLFAVNAEPAFRTGASGRGVTIALIDCGVEQSDANLSRNLSPESTDLNPDRKQPKPENHADFVAAPLDSILDGHGMVGVAYNATLLSVRADFDGGYQGQCAFYSSDLARGIDYAREKGARIIVMPLEGQHPLGAKFEAALQRAVDAGVAIVIAAGNEAAADPSYPARYAADPRYAGAIAVAGAANPDGSIAKWSNRAGAARSYFLLAPGVKVLSDCDDQFCKVVSGTSFATPYIAGALALLMEARPEMSGREALNVLFHGAFRRGTSGNVGRGNLNIGGTFYQLRIREMPKTTGQSAQHAQSPSPS